MLFAAGCGAGAGQVEQAESLFHDAGAVLVDPEEPTSRHVRHDFTFRNPSRETTAVLEVEKSTCGCSEIIVHAREVSPGEAETIRLAYELRLREERRHESVVLTTGLAELPRIVVSLAAEGFPRLATISDPPRHLGVPPGRTEMFEITAVAHREESEPWVPIRTTVEGAGLSLVTIKDQDETMISKGVLRDRATFVFSLTVPELDGPLPLQQAYTGLIEIRHGSRLLTRPVRWAARRFVLFSPKRLFLRGGAEGVPVTVRLMAKEPFRIVSVRADHPAVEWSVEGGYAATEHAIEVRAGTCPGSPVTTTSALHVAIDYPEDPLLTIPVSIVW
jgi:hypothetical protein